MGYREKIAWVSVVIWVLAAVGYAGWLAWQARGMPLADIAYQLPLAGALATVVLLGVLTSVLITATTPPDDRVEDERDRAIDARASRLTTWLLAVGLVVVVGFAMQDAQGFVVAHAAAGAFAAGGLAASLTKAVGYRGGW